MSEFERTDRSITWEEFAHKDFAGKTVIFQDVSDNEGYEIKGIIDTVTLENDKVNIKLKEAKKHYYFYDNDEWDIESELNFTLPKGKEVPSTYPDGTLIFNDCDIFDYVRILP